MSEKPILFSAPMVRAILEGRKTQTRRLVKLREGDAQNPPRIETDAGGRAWAVAGGGGFQVRAKWADCPFGAPGDRLWVRETIRYAGCEGPSDVAVYAADGARTKLDSWGWQRAVLPAIHCPRGLSRIALEVTGVRVERLADISEADARSEGFDSVREFETLWNELNQKRESRWLVRGEHETVSSPWVWVVEFRRARP